jgi:glycosyltransferase involved in cell wall biosynthesis
VLAEAWRLAAPRVPGARLHLVGRGTMREVPEQLVAEFPGRVSWTESLTTPEVALAMDEATALVLASRSEGLPRIVVEAFCRGRPVVGARAGGIPDIVIDGDSGLLVEPEDVTALADALVRILSDRALAQRLGAGARRTADRWLATPEEYAQRVRELVDTVVGS